uniref:Androgen dependent TFPI regulating protein n=1 Tax=Prolemur simus TaxID=1328070 RepID=A0A8C8ZPD9_PROSS
MVPRSVLAITKTFTCIYHFLVLNWYIFLNFYISQHRKNKESSKIFAKGGAWKYLTLLNLLVQAVFYGVACLDDALKRIKGRKSIKFLTAFRDLLFTTPAFPVSTVSHKDAFPKILDGVFPVWLNHARHTSILPLSLAEVILRPLHYPSKKTGLSLLTGAILWIYSEMGAWGYLVHAKLSPLGLAAFFILSYIFSASLYLLGKKINHWKWGWRIFLLSTNLFQPQKCIPDEFPCLLH